MQQGTVDMCTTLNIMKLIWICVYTTQELHSFCGPQYVQVVQSLPLSFSLIQDTKERVCT